MSDILLEDENRLNSQKRISDKNKIQEVILMSETVTSTPEDNQVALGNSALESAIISENNTYAEGSVLADDIMNQSDSILESDVVDSNESNENIEEASNLETATVSQVIDDFFLIVY